MVQQAEASQQRINEFLEQVPEITNTQQNELQLKELLNLKMLV